MEYREKVNENGDRYRGYVNKEGQHEGVGIGTTAFGLKIRGEWRQNLLHGSVKITYENGNTYWGEFKDHMKKGYGTYEFADGNTYIGQYMQDVKHGYGIFRWTADGELHQGQWKFGK